MTNHTKIVNDALHDLMVATFPGIPVELVVQDAEYTPKFKKGEHIEYWLIEQPLVSKNSDGEDREFVYGINHYFNDYYFRRKDFEELYMARYEKLKQALMENRSYYLSGSYIWHDAGIENLELREMDIDEFGHIKYYYSEFHVTRFNQWT